MENVNSCVVGPIITDDYYVFYSNGPYPRLLWDAGWFESDDVAKRAFINKFSVDPYLFRKFKTEGVEMRAYAL